MLGTNVLTIGPDASILQGVGDALDLGVLAVDKQLVITAWNRWLETATGTLAADVIGQPLSALGLPPSAHTVFQRAVNGATVIMSHGLHGYLLHIPIDVDDGDLDHMQQSVRILPVVDAGGTTSGAVAFIRDVTERVAREAELRAAVALAQEANEAKSTFLAAMSHELRTPIGAMLGYADLLADGVFGGVSPDQREKLLRLKGIATHLSSVVDEILTFARLEAGRETANREPVDACQLAREAVLAVEPLLVQKGLALVCGLPDAPIEANTDPTKVRQILINLLGNAVKFTESGSITIEVSADADVVRFTVRDTGPGIDPAEQVRIFEPFVRADDAGASTGTGLGLAVSLGLARLLGGDLTVASSQDGSVFTATVLR